MEVLATEVKREYNTITPDIPNSERETQRLGSVSPNPQTNSQQQQYSGGGNSSRNNSGGSGKSSTVLNHHLTSGGGILTTSSSSTVIQSPSVIQSASGQLQLSKGNVILVSSSSSPSKHQPNSSVIQTAGGGLQSVQILDHHSDESLSNDGVEHPVPINTGRNVDRRRREILTRRPSYRKILSDLGGAEITGGDKGDLSTSESSQDAAEGGGGRIVIGEYPQSMVKVINSNNLGLSGASSGDSVGGTALQTITMTNAGTAGGTIVQYAQSQDGQQFFVPGTVGSELQAYTLRPVSSASSSPSVVLGGSSGGGHHVPEEQTRKREIRLLKNREAARECRRKKKEYIKCLENRVAVLENQNKALIDELKSLKELYCQQKTE